MSDTIPLNRNSGLVLVSNITDEAGAAIDLTGWSASLVDLSAGLEATLEITDAAAGEVTLTIPADQDLRPGRLHHLRTRLDPPSGSASLPYESNRAWVNVQ